MLRIHGLFSVAPSRVRGLKPGRPQWFEYWDRRTLTGAWIETNSIWTTSLRRVVAPSRVRGLKPTMTTAARAPNCRTLTGAWIETVRVQ